jgi:hypothetical protein
LDSEEVRHRVEQVLLRREEGTWVSEKGTERAVLNFHRARNYKGYSEQKKEEREVWCRLGKKNERAKSK